MIRINLLRPESRELKDRVAAPTPEVKEKKPTQLGGLALLLIIVGLVIAFFMQKSTLQKEQRLLENFKREKDQLQYVITSLDQLNAQKIEFEQKINLIKQLKAKQVIPIIIMDELSKFLPEWVWLTEVTFDNILVSIKGNSLAYNLIADYTRDLENSPSLRNVNIVSSAQKSIVGAEQILEFHLTMEYVLPLEAQPPAPAITPAKPAVRGKK